MTQEERDSLTKDGFEVLPEGIHYKIEPDRIVIFPSDQVGSIRMGNRFGIVLNNTQMTQIILDHLSCQEYVEASAQPKQCTCGAKAVNGAVHSAWCDLA